MQDLLKATNDAFLWDVWEGSFLLDEDEFLLHHLILPWGVCGHKEGTLFTVGFTLGLFRLFPLVFLIYRFLQHQVWNT